MNKISKLIFALIVLSPLGFNLSVQQYSQAEDAETAVLAEGRASIKVKGMHCEDCNAAIVNQVKKVEGVRSVTADFKSGTAQVTFDAGTSMQAISKAIEKAGYEVVQISPG